MDFEMTKHCQLEGDDEVAQWLEETLDNSFPQPQVKISIWYAI